MDLFSLTGKIAIEYSDAVKNIERVTEAADDASESLNDVDESAERAGESVDETGESAEKASDGFTTWKGVISNLVSNAISGLISKCTELAGKMVDLTKTAVGNYADYEQLVGGVETLFKDSSDTLIGYAEGAYKTAGLSANDYMDTATSFAASLIQGLGGDTAKAVELTNLAITDMSDNANKMGTDISSIQTAYQGFAKQNYTMLDNLKLGYGGTQEEMIRLINDSGILNEKIESLDDITFDQMIEAIHQIQNNLGITGTTAAEAGSTISGSWGSVQAMFQNILTKVGGELAPTIMGFLSQLSEWMETVDWDAFADAIGNAFGSALEWIQSIDFESFFQKGVDSVLAFVEGLGNFIDKAVDVISNLGSLKDIFEKLAPVIAGVTAAVVAYKTAMAITGIINAAVTAFNAFKTANEGATIAQWLMNAALNANPIVLIVTLIAGLVAAIITLWNTNEDFRNGVIAVWEAIKSAFGTAIEAICTFFSNLWDTVTDVFNNIWETIQSVLTTIGDFISNAFDTIVETVSGALQSVADWFSNIWNSITDFLSSAWETIKNVVQVGIMFIQELITAAFDLITLPFRFIWENCKEYILEAWEAIKTAVSTALDAIKNVISTVWNAIVAFLSPILEGIKNTFTTVWNAIKTAVSTVVNAIKTTISTVWNAISSTVTSVMNTIKTTISNVWNTIKTTVSTVINAIKSVVSSVFNTIKSTISTVLNSIKSTFSNIWNGIKSTVSNVINSIKSTISSGINAAKSTVTSVLDSIKSKFSSIFESAKTIVSNAINKIKSFFNFSWSLPKLKMPHFSITGSFSLSPPSVPHFSIEWYKKAMEDGMIMNEPTIFGYSAKNNQFLAGGEAGSETVVGTSNLMQMIVAAVEEENRELTEKIETLITMLAEYFPAILTNMGREMVLDSGVLVGELAPAMDEELGRIAIRKGR